MSDCDVNQTNFQAKMSEENGKIQSSLGNGSDPTPDSFIFVLINWYLTRDCRLDSYVFKTWTCLHCTREGFSPVKSLRPKGCPRMQFT